MTTRTKVKTCWHCKRPVRETAGKSGLCKKCINLAKKGDWEMAEKSEHLKHQDCGGEVVRIGDRYYCLQCDDQVFREETREE